MRRLIGEAGVVDPGDHGGYERGHRYGAGKAAAVLRPGSTQDVSAVMRYCQANGVRFVAQGANTGLVAASTPDGSGDQIVLNLDRLRGITDFVPNDRSAICRAGTRLNELNRVAEPHGLSLPIDLGADPSLGGMVATNTGGSRLIRYGDMRRNLLGLEVVLADADGTVLSDLKGLRKNNTGLDLKHVFTGTGGAFGVITQVQVELHRLPRQSANALVVPASIEAIPKLLLEVEIRLGELLAAAEGMSGKALQASLLHQPALHNPFGRDPIPDYALLLEASTSLSPDAGVDIERILLESLAPLLDGAPPLATDVKLGRGADFWHVRHGISEGIRAIGKVIAFDISVARSHFPALRRALIDQVLEFRGELQVLDFGHVGDGGVHFNLVLPHGSTMSEGEIGTLRHLVYDCAVREFGGSFSAEHAIGPYNLEFYRKYGAPAERRIAGGIARILNPGGLLGSFDLG